MKKRGSFVILLICVILTFTYSAKVKQAKEEATTQTQTQTNTSQNQTQASGQQAQQNGEPFVSCSKGTYIQNLKCVICSTNCEECSTQDNCNKCKVGFFRVINNETQTCSASIPKGYLPDLSNFEKQNNVTLPETKVYSVAYSGKQIITDNTFQLPFTVSQQGPKAHNGQLVTLDVKPCHKQCKECPSGWLHDQVKLKCILPEKCSFPNREVEENGEKVCKNDDGADLLRAIILFKEKAPKQEKAIKEKKEKSEKLPKLQELGEFSVKTNRKSVTEEMTYVWKATWTKNGTAADYTNEFFQLGNTGARVKAFKGQECDTTQGAVVIECIITHNGESILVSHKL